MSETRIQVVETVVTEVVERISRSVQSLILPPHTHTLFLYYKRLTWHLSDHPHQLSLFFRTRTKLGNTEQSLQAELDERAKVCERLDEIYVDLKEVRERSSDLDADSGRSAAVVSVLVFFSFVICVHVFISLKFWNRSIFRWHGDSVDLATKAKESSTSRYFILLN